MSQQLVCPHVPSVQVVTMAGWAGAGQGLGRGWPGQVPSMARHAAPRPLRSGHAGTGSPASPSSWVMANDLDGFPAICTEMSSRSLESGAHQSTGPSYGASRYTEMPSAW